MAINDDAYRKQQQEKIAATAAAEAAAKKEKQDATAKRQYERSVKTYQNELQLDPPDANPVGYAIRKGMDSAGDTVRSAGQYVFVGDDKNRITSADDAAQMQARRDVKGYKKGGAVKKFARGGGIEVRGKTRGRIC